MPFILQKNIDLCVDVDYDVPEFVIGDAFRLQQILLNLLSNAIKFTERGAITISLSHAGEREGQLLLHFRISDSGIGMAPSVTEQIFRPFEQADPSITRTHGGTGLGLAICRRLAELMGGRIWVESLLGKGSTFHVQIPFNRI